jgi:HAD superfamily hydrolase (TIGR01490 family)
VSTGRPRVDEPGLEMAGGMLDFTAVNGQSDNPVFTSQRGSGAPATTGPATNPATAPAAAPVAALATAPAAAPVVTPPVVFFDLDGTLVVGQTTLLLVKFLRKARIVSRTFMVGTGLWFLGYKAGLLRVGQKSREKGAGVFKGLSVVQVEQLMTRFTDEIILPRLHPAAMAALAGHMAKGDRVVIMSAALEPIVQVFAARLGVPDYVGTGCEIVNGVYSGRLSGSNPHAEEKVRFALAFITESGADPADCWAYADHGTDIALLEAVGHPVAVNPRPEMRQAAERAGWPVLS